MAKRPICVVSIGLSLRNIRRTILKQYGSSFFRVRNLWDRKYIFSIATKRKKSNPDFQRSMHASLAICFRWILLPKLD